MGGGGGPEEDSRSCQLYGIRAWLGGTVGKGEEISQHCCMLTIVYVPRVVDYQPADGSHKAAVKLRIIIAPFYWEVAMINSFQFKIVVPSFKQNIFELKLKF